MQPFSPLATVDQEEFWLRKTEPLPTINSVLDLEDLPSKRLKNEVNLHQTHAYVNTESKNILLTRRYYYFPTYPYIRMPRRGWVWYLFEIARPRFPSLCKNIL